MKRYASKIADTAKRTIHIGSLAMLVLDAVGCATLPQNPDPDTYKKPGVYLFDQNRDGAVDIKIEAKDLNKDGATDEVVTTYFQYQEEKIVGKIIVYDKNADGMMDVICSNDVRGGIEVYNCKDKNGELVPQPEYDK